MIHYQREHITKTNLNLGTYAKDDGRRFFATMYDGKVQLLNAGKNCKDASVDRLLVVAASVACTPGGQGIQN